MARKELAEHAIALSISTLVVLGIGAVPALAQSTGSGWEEPAVDLGNTIMDGLTKIAAPLIGMGIMIVGLWACVTGRLDWSKFGNVVLGAGFVAFGPMTMQALFGFMQ